MTPNEQNQNLIPNSVYGKYPCPPDMVNRVIPIIITAVNFCNAFSSDTKEQKAEKLTLWVEAQYEERALDGFCPLEDIQAHGLALGIVCRYRDTVIEPMVF
jgi:hypothetical protein